MEPGTLFNLIPFAGGVSRWLEGGISGSGSASRDEAKAFVQGLTSEGGTNLYGALREAFGDQEVDTIFVLSDGEPTAGAKQDAWEIRREVELWNEDRGVVIHTIAVGGGLKILEWLAEDSGGSFTQFR
jgi:hypothetical protein